MNPLVSIITVVFNGAQTLEQTIQSVLGQTYKNIEYIVVDGGSTDGTLEIIKKYEDRIARWVSEPDKGLYDAMNKGISMAKGELIGMINSDDWYEPNAVELIVDAYQKHPGKKIFHGDRYDVLDGKSRQVRRFNPSRAKFLYYGMTYNHPSMFVHKDVYRDNRYNILLKSLSDFEFILRQYLKAEDSFHYIPEAYVDYRLDGVSAQMNYWGSAIENYQARRNAGMGLFGSVLFLMVRALLYPNYKIRRLG